MNTINKKFYDLCNKKEVVMGVHRGFWAMNVIQNTYTAYMLAKRFGGDIVEIDIAESKDGVLYGFHEGYEYQLFKTNKKIKEMTSTEVEALPFINSFGGDSGEKIEPLESMLAKLKGKGIINIDKCWIAIDKIMELTDKLEMHDEILLKSKPFEHVREALKNHEKKFMFMPIAYNLEEFKYYEDEAINNVAVEIIFEEDDSEILSEASFRYFKERNIVPWVNALYVGTAHNWSGTRHDHLALENPDEGWGWLIDKGFKIIQTDWPFIFKEYIETREKRQKKVS